MDFNGITDSITEKKVWYSLLICNGYGLLINIAMLFLYLFLYLEKNIKKFIGYGLFVVNLLLEVSYLMEVWVINKRKDSNDLVGFVATLINILMYLSLLQIFLNYVQLENMNFYLFLLIYLVFLQYFFG